MVIEESDIEEVLPQGESEPRTSHEGHQCKDKVDSNYPGLYLLTKTNIFRKAEKDATVKYINLDHLKKMDLPLPPLDNQIRIAIVLTRAKKLIAKRKESIKALDKLLKSAFLELWAKCPISSHKISLC